MSLPTKKKRKLDTFELSRPARAALRRIKQIHGISKVESVQRGIFKLEAELLKGLGDK